MKYMCSKMKMKSYWYILLKRQLTKEIYNKCSIPILKKYLHSFKTQATKHLDNMIKCHN